MSVMLTGRRASDDVEFEVSWNGTIAARTDRAEQRSPAEKPAHPAVIRGDVLAYVEQFPGATLRGISDGTGYTLGSVAHALGVLREKGVVTGRRVVPESHTSPMQWRVRRGGRS